jgi:hypothetical protein
MSPFRPLVPDATHYSSIWVGIAMLSCWTCYVVTFSCLVVGPSLIVCPFLIVGPSLFVGLFLFVGPSLFVSSSLFVSPPLIVGPFLIFSPPLIGVTPRISSLARRARLSLRSGWSWCLARAASSDKEHQRERTRNYRCLQFHLIFLCGAVRPQTPPPQIIARSHDGTHGSPAGAVRIRTVIKKTSTARRGRG